MTSPPPCSSRPQQTSIGENGASAPEVIPQAQSRTKFATFLFGISGGIGLVLASIGIFGVVSYSVSRRTREFGIRMALGATPASVLRLVLTSMGCVLIIGFIIGTIFSVISTRALADRLEGVGATSPIVLIVVIAALAIAALTACTLPARTATQIHPVEALRHE